MTSSSLFQPTVWVPGTKNSLKTKDCKYCIRESPAALAQSKCVYSYLLLASACKPAIFIPSLITLLCVSAISAHRLAPHLLRLRPRADGQTALRPQALDTPSTQRLGLSGFPGRPGPVHAAGGARAPPQLRYGPARTPFRCGVGTLRPPGGAVRPAPPPLPVSWASASGGACGSARRCHEDREVLLLLRAHLPGPRRHVRAQRLQGTAGGRERSLVALREASGVLRRRPRAAWEGRGLRAAGRRVSGRAAGGATAAPMWCDASNCGCHNRARIAARASCRPDNCVRLALQCPSLRLVPYRAHRAPQTPVWNEACPNRFLPLPRCQNRYRHGRSAVWVTASGAGADPAGRRSLSRGTAARFGGVTAVSAGWLSCVRGTSGSTGAAGLAELRGKLVARECRNVTIKMVNKDLVYCTQFL